MMKQPRNTKENGLRKKHIFTKYTATKIFTTKMKIVQ